MKMNYADMATRSILSLDREDEDQYKITRISVFREHRRQGIGSRLLRECLRDADIEGITLTLEPIPTLNEGEDLDEVRNRLIKWYERHGFKPTTRGDGTGFIW